MAVTRDDFKLTFLSPTKKHSLINGEFDAVDAALGELKEVLDKWGAPGSDTYARYEVERMAGGPRGLSLGDDHAGFVSRHARLMSEFQARYREAGEKPIRTYKALKQVKALVLAQCEQARAARGRHNAEARTDLDEWATFEKLKTQWEKDLPIDSPRKLAVFNAYARKFNLAALESRYTLSSQPLYNAVIAFRDEATQDLDEAKAKEREWLRETFAPRAAEFERAEEERARAFEKLAEEFLDDKVKWKKLGFDEGIPAESDIEASRIQALQTERWNRLKALDAESADAAAAIAKAEMDTIGRSNPELKGEAYWTDQRMAVLDAATRAEAERFLEPGRYRIFEQVSEEFVDEMLLWQDAKKPVQPEDYFETQRAISLQKERWERLQALDAESQGAATVLSSTEGDAGTSDGRLAVLDAAARADAENFFAKVEKLLDPSPSAIQLAYLLKDLVNWNQSVPSGIPGDPDRDGPLFLALEKQVSKVIGALSEDETADPPELLTQAEEALELARSTLDAWLPDRVEELRAHMDRLNALFPEGKRDASTSSEARGPLETLAGLEKAVLKVAAQHPILDEANKLRQSLLRLGTGGMEGLSEQQKARHDSYALYGNILDRLNEAERERFDQLLAVSDPSGEQRTELDQLREKALREDGEALAAWKNQITDGLEWGQYAPGRKVESGGAGIVFFLNNARDEDPPLVGKTFKPHSDSEGKEAMERGVEEEVDRELAVYEKLGAHPNIARVFGKHRFETTTRGGIDKILLVMESIPGGETGDAMIKGQALLQEGRLTSEEYWGAVQHIMRGTLRGLVHMEAKGLGHNDIKPPNVMINADGDPVLIDMGGGLEIGEESEDGTRGYTPSVEREVQGQMRPVWEEKSGGKRDLFGVGGMARVAGGDEEPSERVKAWSWVLDSPSANVFKGVAAKGDPGREGHYAARNAYTAFVKATYARDPEVRPTLAEALKMPFLADALLAEDEARAAVKKITGLI